MDDRRASAWLEEGISLPVFIVNAMISYVRICTLQCTRPMCPAIETKMKRATNYRPAFSSALAIVALWLWRTSMTFASRGIHTCLPHPACSSPESEQLALLTLRGDGTVMTT
ncbi:hypothetical protein GY45DRAFT_496830 [Cubamyces sp. BRFM 1775]|nr:hypothetical protein GY45DRAFT_496830 [Cubamyces sp. BRFM 1775]